MPSFDAKRCSWAGLDPTMIDTDDEDDDSVTDDSNSYGQDELSVSRKSGGGPANRRSSWGDLESMIAEALPASSAPDLDSILEDNDVELEDSKTSLRSSLSSSCRSSNASTSASTTSGIRKQGKSKKAELLRKMKQHRRSSTDKSKTSK